MERESGRAERSMSYKFQRLRESVRRAIQTGELAGKLPGERILAKRFHANAKTLSKALTDLAAEGLLDRSIGRGTYVHGAVPDKKTEGRWLMLCNPGDPETPLMQRLRLANAQTDAVRDLAAIRPSLLVGVTGVIDCCSNTPEDILRNLVVRNLPVVSVDKQSTIVSTHSVQLDYVLAASQLARRLMLDGHERVISVETQGQNLLCEAFRTAARRYNDHVEVDVCGVEDVAAVLNSGRTAIVCAGEQLGRQVMERLAEQRIGVPEMVSVAAIGTCADLTACTGYYTSQDAIASSVIHLLREAPMHRPVSLWLAGELHDCGTIAPRRVMGLESISTFRLSGLAV